MKSSSFRKRDRVRLSPEGREKMVASPSMRGVVEGHVGDLVSVIEDGYSGKTEDYHPDFLEKIPGKVRRIS